ncbi:hypothetical protein F5Y10DRAFT_230029 [Nemania abortiva]|nr:hypothetical protein F5Y10DRAFT_230029 [Nemania abortiva]
MSGTRRNCLSILLCVNLIRGVSYPHRVEPGIYTYIYEEFVLACKLDIKISMRLEFSYNIIRVLLHRGTIY